MAGAAGGGTAGAPTGGTAGVPASGDGGSAVVAPGTPLAWGANAQLVANNPFGMRGTWFVAFDCVDVAAAIADGRFVCPADPPTPNCCTAWDPLIVGPPPESAPGLSVDGGTQGDGLSRACLKGTVTQIVNDAFNVQWGAVLQLQLDAGQPFDTTRSFPGGKIVGFSVELDGPFASLPLRVGYQTTMNESYFVEVTVPSTRVELLFSEVKLGEWVMPQVPFDATQVVAVTVGVPPDPTTITPVDFCVRNVRVLQEGDVPSGN